MNMMKFIDNIVCCLIADILSTKKIKQKALSAGLNKTNQDFPLKFYKNKCV